MSQFMSPEFGGLFLIWKDENGSMTNKNLMKTSVMRPIVNHIAVGAEDENS